MRSRVLPLLGLLLAAVLLAFLVPAGAADAYSITWIQNPQTDGCLTDDGHPQPVIGPCYIGHRDLQWYISGYDGAGRYYNIKNRATGRCLDYYPGHLSLNVNCWNFQSQYKDFQSWHFSGTGGAGFTIQAKIQTPCLYGVGGNYQPVTTAPCASGGAARAAEIWTAKL